MEALHLACLMAAHGYFFPIEDHILTLRNDGTYYRFQVREAYRWGVVRGWGSSSGVASALPREKDFFCETLYSVGDCP